MAFSTAPTQKNKKFDIHYVTSLIKHLPLIITLSFFSLVSTANELIDALKNQAALTEIEKIIATTPTLTIFQPSPLLYATSFHTKAIQLLLQSGIDIDIQDARGVTALHVAAKYQSNSIALLLDNGASLNIQNSNGLTALHLAAGAQSKKNFEYMDGQYMSRPVAATNHSNHEALLKLLAAGADYRITDNIGRTALHYAAQFYPTFEKQGEDTSLVSPLLNISKKKLINAKDKYQRTALHYATYYPRSIEKEDYIKEEERGYDTFILWDWKSKNTLLPLLQRGAHIRAKDNNKLTPLHLAIRNKSTAFQNLLNRGARVNAKSKKKYTPLHYAASYYPSAIPILIQAGANIKAKTKNKKTALHLAAKHQTQAIAPLIAAQSNVNATDINRDTPLIFACIYNPSAVPILLQAGANIDVTNSTLLNPLHLATLYQPTLIKTLIDAGSDVNVATLGMTALHYATWTRTIAIEPLLENGADVNAKNLQLWTPLHYAVRYQNQQTMQQLLNAGADINAMTKKHWTPLHLAATYHPDLIINLLDAGANLYKKTDAGFTAATLLQAKFPKRQDLLNRLQVASVPQTPN